MKHFIQKFSIYLYNLLNIFLIKNFTLNVKKIQLPQKDSVSEIFISRN